MTLTARRAFLITSTLGVGALLAGCGGSSPTVLTVNAQGETGMNPSPSGGDRPVTLTVLQMASASAFDSADYFALQNPQSALGSDLIQSDQLVLAPGGNATKPITIQPGTTVIGVVGGFRDPAGRTVRSKVSVPSSRSQILNIIVGANGLSLSSA